MAALAIAAQVLIPWRLIAMLFECLRNKLSALFLLSKLFLLLPFRLICRHLNAFLRVSWKFIGLSAAHLVGAKSALS